MKVSKTFAFCAAAITCAALLPAAANAAEDVVIGVIVPTTGALAPLGIDMKNGYELAAKDHPTVKGKPVRLVIEDDQGNAASGLMKAQKLVIKDRAPILVGGATSALVLGLAAQADRLNVPIVTTNAQAVQVTGAQCNRFVFRTNPNDAMVGNATRVLMQKRPELLQKNGSLSTTTLSGARATRQSSPKSRASKSWGGWPLNGNG
ncbi:ABC transporter substrate-binding protein [Cupriavidus basilensis]